MKWKPRVQAVQACVVLMGAVIALSVAVSLFLIGLAIGFLIDPVIAGFKRGRQLSDTHFEMGP